MIVARNVSKRYGGNYGVRDVSVQIAKGRITSFIGPNGAGKSTFLSLISRLQPMDEGEARIDGLEVGRADNKLLARKIAILKQTNHLNVRLTVRQLVTFGRFPHSGSRITAEDKRYVDEAIRYMNLEDLQHQFLDRLSGGQKQRAFIAMVLAQDTQYVLLDEPLNNLDIKHSVQIMQVLRGMVDELGKTVVLVLHDINFASAYSDTIVAMKGGRIVGEGPTDRMIDSGVLRDVYEMEIPIHVVNDKKICVYFS